MKFLVELNHPKHYYQFKAIANTLLERGHDVQIIAKDKDVLLRVLQEEGVQYWVFGTHKKSMAGKLFGAIGIYCSYYRIMRRFQPDVVISKASVYGVVMAKFMHKKSVIFPDSEVVALTNKVVVPKCTKVVTPNSFGLDYGEKHIRVKGFFENCYLAPSVFVPNKSVVEQYGMQCPFAVLRFIGWSANHDVHQYGFSDEEKVRLFKELSRYMKVYVSAETELPEVLRPHLLPTPAAKIHDVLAAAELYVGDSQTMATEAALLATPSIRYNSFVGEHDMTNFKILESSYRLLVNCSSFEQALSKAVSFAEHSQKHAWRENTDNYYQTVGDVNAEIVNILESL